jgi:hypothetical protein
MKTLSPCILAALLATGPLRAEAPRYGVQGLVNIPLNDLKAYVDSRPGPGFGFHGTFDLNDGHMLRPRLDYNIFPEASFDTITKKASNLSLGGDYLYFIAQKPEGFYFTGGLAAMRWSFEQKNAAGKDTSSTTKLGLAAGIGYQWSATVGTEVRWVESRVAQTFKANALQVGVTVRF